MKRNSWTSLVVAFCFITTISATTMTIGFISCEKNSDQFERFQKYLNAAKTKLGVSASDDVALHHFSISIKQPDQNEAEKMMQNVTKFVDPSDPGTALVGCWVRDTKIAISAHDGFPYFVYLPLFPDFINNKDGTISVDRRVEKLTDSVTTLTPPINAFARPIMNYLKEIKKIKRCVVLVVGAEGQLQFGDGLKDSLAADDIDLEYVRLTKWAPQQDVKAALIGIRTKTVPNIIVHSTDVIVLTYIIEKARELNLMTKHYTWYFTYPDFDGLLAYYGSKHDLDNIVNASIVVGMQLIDRSVFEEINMMPKPENADKVLEDAFYYDVSAILLKALKAKTGNPTKYTNTMLVDYVNNILLQDESFSGALGKYQPFLPAPVAYKGRMMSRISGEMTWKGIYYKTVNQTLAKSNIELGTPAVDGDSIPVIVTVPKFEITDVNNVVMPDFNMRELKVVAKLDPPLIMYNASLNPPYRGVMVDLMDEYANFMHVKWKIVNHVHDVENYGVSNSEELDTIVDHLREGKADIAMGAFGSNLQRAEIISFTDTTIPCAVSLLMKKPKLEYSIFQFITPFKTSMWVSIFVVFIIVSILLTIMDVLDWTDENFPVRDSFYYVAGVLLSGTTDTNPASFPSRMLVGCFIFFAIVTFQSYTANMAAFLTTRDEFQGIPRTLYDVATRTSKDIIAIDKSEILTILDKAKKDPYNQISTRVERVANHEVAKKRVLENDSVLISDTSFTEFVTADDPYNECNYMDREQDADTIRYAFALPYGAEYRDALNFAIGALKKDGHDREIIKRWYKQPICQLEDGGSGGNLQTKSLTMLEMSGIFITLGGGLVLSLLVAIFGELMVRYYYKKPGTNFLGFIDYFGKIPGRLRNIMMVWTNADRRRAGQRGQKGSNDGINGNNK